MSNNPATLPNLVLAAVTTGFNILLDDEVFDCPKEGFKTYGYTFLLSPCVILLFVNMMVIVETWNPFKICSELKESASKKEHLFKVTLLSVARVFVAPIMWLIVSFADSSYYVCAKVGPNNSANLNTSEAKALEDMIASTKKESQVIAWGLFIGMVSLIFLLIALENWFSGKSTVNMFMYNI